MGVTLVRTMGNTDTYSIPGLTWTGIGTSGRNAFRLSNGNILYVMVDHNQSATGGQGDNSNVPKIYVYERNVATNVVTLRATLSPGGTIDAVTGALFSNNDLAIVWTVGGQGQKWDTLKYAKMTYSTYTMSAVETVINLTADGDDATFSIWKAKFFDVDVTDDGAVLVFWKRNVVLNGLAAPYNTQGVYISVACRTTGGTWVNTMLTQEVSSTNLVFNSTLTFESVSGASLGGTATARRFVWASSTRIDAWGSQDQFRVGRGTINTSTGAVTSTNLEAVWNSWTPGYPYLYGHSANTKIWRESSASDNYVIGHANSTGWGVVRGSWNGSTFVFQQPLSMTGWPGGSQALGQDYVLADAFPGMSYGGSKMVFWTLGQDVPGNTSDTASPAFASFKIDTLTVHLDASASTSIYSGFAGKANDPVAAAYNVSSSGNRNYSIDSHEILSQYGAGAGGQIWAVWTKVPAPGGGSGILNLSPPNGGTVTSAQPLLTGQIDTDVTIDWSMYRLEYQFAENNTFSVGLIDWVEQVGSGATGYNRPYTDPQANMMKEVSFTNQAGVTKAFSNTLPLTAGSLHAGVWYYRARLVNEAGQVGAWTSTNSFTIGHPSVTIPLTPGGNRYFTYGSGNMDFTWKFTDPSPTDFQTAYQVIVKNEVTGVTIFDTGKVITTNKYHTGNIAVTHKDQQLSWQVRTWDSDDANGVYSDKVTFYMTDPPVVTITAPTAGSTQATPRPNITFNVTTSGGRTVSEATVIVSQAGVALWSQRIMINAASGVSKTVRVDPGILNDGQSYSVQVAAVDSSGLKTSSGLISFTADWTPPAAPAGVAVSVSPFNIEGQGYVEVTWNNSTNDANFVYYVVYRRDDLINPNTGAVLQTGVPKVVNILYASAPVNTFRDYNAPSNYKVNYLVRQVSQSNTVEIESSNTTYTTATAVSDGYWLIQTDDAGNTIDAFKISIVTGDSYTNEQEMQEFVIQGRGRVVNKGQIAGMKGSLDCRIRDTGIYTARQKKQKIEAIAESMGTLWLRNPFGDIFRVNVSAVSIARIAGVGGSEFCDMTIPYAEVAQ